MSMTIKQAEAVMRCVEAEERLWEAREPSVRAQKALSMGADLDDPDQAEWWGFDEAGAKAAILGLDGVEEEAWEDLNDAEAEAKAVGVELEGMAWLELSAAAQAALDRAALEAVATPDTHANATRRAM